MADVCDGNVSVMSDQPNPYEAFETPETGVALNAGAKTDWREIAARWERYRIPFNICLLVLGTGLLVMALGQAAIAMIPDVIVFGVVANLCYLFGPITEMYLGWFVERNHNRIPPAIATFVLSAKCTTWMFLAGLTFSIMLTCGAGFLFLLDSLNQQ